MPQNEGFLCHIQLHSKLDVPQEAAYQMVTDPDNYRYFRNVTVSACISTCPAVVGRKGLAHGMADQCEPAQYDCIKHPPDRCLPQECTHRKVVHDDGKGRKRVEVDHKSEWRFLWHHGSFTTCLLVEQVSRETYVHLAAC